MWNGILGFMVLYENPKPNQHPKCLSMCNNTKFSLKCCGLYLPSHCKFHYIFKDTLTAVAEGWRQTEQDLCVFKGCWQQGKMQKILKRMNCQLLLHNPRAIQQFTSKISDSNYYVELFHCLSHLWIECGNKLADLEADDYCKPPWFPKRKHGTRLKMFSVFY